MDKTSDVIGTRQAGVFQTLRGITGRDPIAAKAGGTSKPAAKTQKQKVTKSEKVKEPPRTSPHVAEASPVVKTKKDMALTVRIEINLPSEASAETYDNIFKKHQKEPAE